MALTWDNSWPETKSSVGVTWCSVAVADKSHMECGSAALSQPLQATLHKRQEGAHICFNLQLGKTRVEKCFCSKYTELKDK